MNIVRMGLTSSLKGKSREKWLRLFARLGLGSHGVVYCLMSFLSLLTAIGLNDKAAGKSEAFKTIYEQPFGRVLLVIIGVFMLGYVLLRFFQAFADTRREGKDAKGVSIRAWMFLSGLIYLGLSFTAINLAVFGAKDEGDKKKLLVDKALDVPGGVLLVGIAGAILAGSGVYQIYRGASRKFMKRVDLHHSDFKKAFETVGVIGHIARGIVFCILGYFLIRAASNADPGAAANTDGAFDFMREKFGNLLMGIVAAGLFAYGIFMLVRAKHEKMSFGQG